MRHLHLALFALIATAPSAAAQFDSSLWLVGAGGSPSGTQVYEISRDGATQVAYPGPLAGASAVAKDLLGQVLVADAAGQEIRVYQSGLGLTSTLPTVDMVGMAILPSGTLAVVSAGAFSPFAPGSVQLMPIASPALPPIAIPAQPTRVVADRGETVWVLHLFPGQVSRITNGALQTAVPLAAVSTNTPLDLVLRPGGGVLVSFQSSPMIAVIDQSGQFSQSLVLGEPPVRMISDGDQGLIFLGQSGQIRRQSLKTGMQVETWFPVASNNYGFLVSDQRGSLYIEDIEHAQIHHYGYGGAFTGTYDLTGMPATGTSSPGDPLGFQFAAMVGETLDADQDGFTNRIELLRASSLFDPTDVPCTLSLTPDAATDTVVVDIASPGRMGQLAVTMISISGTASRAMGQMGAPYYDLTFDFVAYASLVGQVINQPFLGVESVILDAAGLGSFVCDFSTVGLAPNSLTVFVSTLVTQQAGSILDLTDVVSEPVSFTNP